jgi:hypothetical protein
MNSQKIKIIYIRLLTYKQATEFIQWFNSNFNNSRGKNLFANFVAEGGISIQGFESQIEQSITFLEEKEWNYEMSFSCPTNVKIK